MRDARVWPRPQTSPRQLGTGEPHFIPHESPLHVPSCAETPQSKRGLKSMEKPNMQVVLMLPSDLVWGAELLFERLEPLSTKIPKQGRQNKHK